MMKGISWLKLFIFVLAATALFAYGCSSEEEATEETATEEAAPAEETAAVEEAAPAEEPAPAEEAAPAEEPLVITFASDCTWPPMEFIGEDGEIVGFSVDLLQAMGEAGNFVPDIQNTAWDGIFAGLAAGKYQAISSSVSITDERRETMDFSDPYFEVKQGVIVAKDSAIASADDLAGLVVGAQIGTTGFFAAENVGAAEAKSYDEIGLAVEDLYNGNLDAVICDDTTAFDYALAQEKYSEALKIAFLLSSDTPEYLGFAVQKGDTATLEILNAALAAVKASGQYDEIVAKWFGSN